MQRRKYVAVAQETIDLNGNSLTPLTPSSGLPGDFNNDGAVDAADYNVWRENVGQPESGNVLSGNGNGGVVDQSDYDLWVSSFGR